MILYFSMSDRGGENLKKVKVYAGLILTFVISYILICLVDNYSYLLGFVSKFMSLLTPFIIGAIIAYVLSPLVDWMEKKLKLKRWMTIFIIYGVTIFMSIGFIIMILPFITSSIIDIINQIPQYAADVEQWITNNFEALTNNFDTLIVSNMSQIQDALLAIIPKISTLAKLILDNFLGATVSITTIVVNIALGLIISIYMIIDKEEIISYIKKVVFIVFKKDRATLIVDVVKTFNSNIGTYIVAKSIDSFFVGVVSFIGLAVIGSKYSLLFGIICGFTNMIPYFGPIIGMVPVILINIFYSPAIAIGSWIFLLLLQQIEGNIIEPKFVGGKLGLSPLLTLLAVSIGGGFFGILGMILSVPVMGVIKIYIEKNIEKYSYRLEE